jgi:16S rRNA (adenine1518-N6/adenine1519-N6)-dimethyltransferase
MIDLIKSYRAENRSTKKSLGQHFLINRDALNAIVENCSISDRDIFLEIGAGCGILTQALLERNAEVVAIEVDKALCDFLERYLFYYPELTIKNVDFLEYSIKEGKIKIVGNLPYNRAASILIHTVNYIERIEQMVLMFQREVAERILSTPNKRSYGYLSVIIQYYFDIKLIMTLKGDSFWPTTKVDSMILMFAPKKNFPLAKENESSFFRFVKDCFKMKRKTLKNNLKGYENIENLSDYIKRNVKVRAEELTLNDFIFIFEMLYNK